jgi:DNA-binding CsgD family transcriptional regulator
MSSAEPLGRDDELAAVERLFTRSSKGPGILLLEGIAGIGKTTLWLRGLELARRHGFRVLSCRPSPAETPLAFSALGDLLGGLGEESLRQLPPPQRRALEIGLLLREADGGVPDQRAVSLATLTLLRATAEKTPLLIAIDDIQWLDASSARVLAFVFRRLELDRCRVLLARRIERESGPALPLNLELASRSLGSVEHRTIGPLSLGALQNLIRTRLAVRLPRPVIVSICDAAGGNPFYALELARAQLKRTALEPGRPLRVPESLGGLIQQRLEALAPSTRKALLISATLSQPTVTVLGEADGASLVEAVEAGIVEIDRGSVRFTHPLPASVVYAEASVEERRAAHARAAVLTKNQGERAHHLALASAGPDEKVARELEQAAAAAVARAAPDSAAELSELAAKLTPPADREALARRRLTTAEQLFVTGEAERCRSLLEALIGELGPCPQRADALVLLSETVPDLDEAVRLCRQALEEADDDNARAAKAAIVLGASFGRENRYAEHLEAARIALRHAELSGDKVLLIEALQGVANAGVLLGGPIDDASMQRALELEREIGGLPGRRSPRLWHGWQHFWLDDLEAAGPIVRSETERALAEGQLTEWLHLMPMLINLEIRVGNWDLAESYCEQALPEARDVGISYTVQNLEVVHLGLRSMRGEKEARSNLIEAYERGLQSAHIQAAYTAIVYLAMFDQAKCDYAEAWQWISSLLEIHKDGEPPETGPSLDQPRIILHRSLAAELLLALGEGERAERYVDELTQVSERTRSPLALALAARSRALLAALRGDLDASREAFKEALEAHAGASHAFELARTELYYGTTLRRAKRRGEARRVLTRALDRFEKLGAAEWAKRTHSELARTGVGRRAEGSELTATERRVAELVASGQSNKDVAAALFVSVRTVEANLSKIFRKLGIESRSELAGRLRDDLPKEPEIS